MSVKVLAMELAEDSMEDVEVEMVEDSFEGLEVADDSFEDHIMEIAEDSMEGVEGEIVEDSLEVVAFEELGDEVQSNNIEDCPFPHFDLNKFPEDDYENDSYEEKEKKQLLMTFCRIYLDRFY
ncbi:hypothetical protein MTR_7g104915 [Medicago truncatula]|uniref:Uncharacterized protein n=3 Tax=Medicago truncatula TaxID=3880 RepID=Q2HTF7_MEDTR|nr:hypothetical protein MtrDRAFT_AC150442g6v2 [Medicago truncatula]KEH24144.1 hypothetical protein MTR_7g104915 [Medicago truncatula]